jgi:hypothetical protein
MLSSVSSLAVLAMQQSTGCCICRERISTVEVGNGELNLSEGVCVLQQALQKIMEGCGAAFQPHVTPELRRLLFRALLHPNRFVRETGYHITATLCTLCAGPQLEAFAPEVAERLQDGLSENWSQVLTPVKPFHMHKEVQAQ